jgi:ubiquinone/menaquinone biosynthesis C-methylase UbiE
LPCGAGRFWALLAKDPERTLFASDYSENMIKTAQTQRPPAIAKRFECFQASAFDTKRPDNFVDCVFCMRLMHHVGESRDRLVMLKEFYRIARQTVIISLWVDGNFKARKRQQAEAKRIAQGKPLNNRYLINAKEFEQECAQAGFTVVGSIDVLKHFLMWRIYVLRKNA